MSKSVAASPATGSFPFSTVKNTQTLFGGAWSVFRGVTCRLPPHPATANATSARLSRANDGREKKPVTSEIDCLTRARFARRSLVLSIGTTEAVTTFRRGVAAIVVVLALH